MSKCFKVENGRGPKTPLTHFLASRALSTQSSIDSRVLNGPSGS
ncbi:unnamed protein product, partial [Didymodactylos carnosus]